MEQVENSGKSQSFDDSVTPSTHWFFNHPRWEITITRETRRSLAFWLKDGGPMSHCETGCHWLLTVPEIWDDHLTVWLLLRPLSTDQPTEMTLMLVCSCAFLCVWCRFTYITELWFSLHFHPATCTQLAFRRAQVYYTVACCELKRLLKSRSV